MNFRRLALLLIAGLAGAAPARGEVVILGYTIGYGVPDITTAKPPAEYARVNEVLKRSGLEIRWEPTTLERRFETLKSGPANFCMPGVFKTAERMTIATFSEAYETQEPYIVLSLASKAAEIRQHGTIAALLADPRLTVLRWDGFSYGEALDAKIRDAGGHAETVFSDAADPAGMLVNGRADYTLARHAMAVRAIEGAGYSVQNFGFTALPDMPAAEPVYFMCNKAVPASLLDTLNRAIRAVRDRPARDEMQ